MERLLEDRDIFIYLGEKAFCSDECRNGFIEEAKEEEYGIVLVVHATGGLRDNMENFNPLSENGEQVNS
ncbi:Soluble starch synthase 1, chloroplastic/amyloplastic [Zea mays]|uniref:Soluble starch synthase 1, chloroplastic/amyloplastic n=1 Tax=Zea mays TaxID=4577 RepID=A0A3L6EVX5_MAIZE|nr:Soluble starch synthase 1, chloroplastic/amyloplastic [Zea mays]